MGDVPVAPDAATAMSAPSDIDPTKPVKFEGNAGAGDSLIRYSPQTTGVSCAGFAIAYALIRTGATRDSSGRGTDVTALKDLLAALGTPVSATDGAVLAAYQSGAMLPAQLQQMANVIYLGGIGTITAAGQAGYTASQVTRYLNALSAFGGLSGLSFNILNYKMTSDNHFVLQMGTDYASSIGDATTRATVASDPQLPADSVQFANIAYGSTLTLTKVADSGSGNSEAVGACVTITLQTVSHDMPGYQTADSSALTALTGTPKLVDL